MTAKKALESRIRGWFPQEPQFPSRNSPTQLPPKPKPPRKRGLTGVDVLLIFVTSFVTVTLMMQMSATAIALLAIMLTFLTGSALFSRSSKQRIYRFFRYGTTFILVFCFLFASLGIFFFYTSGYPPTLVPQTSYPQILDASLTSYLRSVEYSPGFLLFQAEHLGTVFFAGVSISTTYSNTPQHLGGITWNFYAKDINVKVTAGEITGSDYKINTLHPFGNGGNQIPTNFPSPESVSASLEQIDALGLRWFHNQAVDRYKNETGSNPAISNLNVNVAFNENYNGITLRLGASHQSTDQRGTLIYQSIFRAEFQPNGTLLDFSVT